MQREDSLETDPHIIQPADFLQSCRFNATYTKLQFNGNRTVFWTIDAETIGHSYA